MLVIQTKLYGVCRAQKNCGYNNYYNLTALEDSFFYKKGQNFNIFLTEREIHPITHKQLTLF